VFTHDFSNEGRLLSDDTDCDLLLFDRMSVPVLCEKLDLLRVSLSTFFSLIGTPPPRPLGADVLLPFAAYFFLSSIDDNLDPNTDENPEPLLPLDVTDALDDCTGDMVLFHGVK
jgi:hypothetical protein